MRKKMICLIALLLISVLSFSGATYAGFTKQYNPWIDKLNFTVATQEYMMISKTGEKGTFKDNIEFSELITTHVTLTAVDAVVTENSISFNKNGVVAPTDSYIKFSLYFSGSNDMNIYLRPASDVDIERNLSVTNALFTEEQIRKAVDSIRIGFLAYSTRETVVGSGIIENEYDPIKTNIYSENQKNDESYSGIKPYDTFYKMQLGYTDNGLDDEFALLSAQANKVSKLDIFIWLENQDLSASESLFNIALSINLRFLAVNVESGE